MKGVVWITEGTSVVRCAVQHLRSFSEAFLKKLGKGQLSPETLTHVVSHQEEDHQHSLALEPSRHLRVHLDSTLTIQTRRRYMSKVPASIEELRWKYEVIEHMWLLAHRTRAVHHSGANAVAQTE